MSTTVDNRVVEMQFDNKEFERNVKTSISTLDKLKKALKLDNAAKGFEDLDKAAKSVNFDSLSESVDKIEHRFSAFEVFSNQIIRNLANSFYDLGRQATAFIKSMTVDQVGAGWSKYEQKTEAVQTIMNATGKNIDEVNSRLEKLMWFSDETSYNFTDMTSNVGKFTSYGVDLDSAVTSMIGIANWAAVSGQNAQTASRAMLNLSQAIGMGKLTITDWKSIELANMATKEFKEQAIQAGLAAGTLKEVNGQITTLNGKAVVTAESMRETLSQDWFTSDVITRVLKAYGEYTEAVYNAKEEGEAASEVMDRLGDAGMTLSAKAFKAAQEAKTWTDVVDATKDAVSSGWLETFEMIFGNYEKAKETWTGIVEDFWELFASGGIERNSILRRVFSDESFGFDGIKKKLTSSGVDVQKFYDSLENTLTNNGNSVSALVDEYGNLENAINGGAISVDNIRTALQNLLPGMGQVTTKAVDLEAKLVEVQGVVDGVLRGDYGSGHERKEALESLGYDYEYIQNLADRWVGLGGKVTMQDMDIFIGEVSTEQAEALREWINSTDDASDSLEHFLATLNVKSGRMLFAESLRNILQTIISIKDTFGESFTQMFGSIDDRATALYKLIEAFHSFTTRLLITEERAAKLTSIFNGLLSIIRLVAFGFKTAARILSPIGKAITDIFGPIGTGLAKIGDDFTAFVDNVINSEKVEKTIVSLTNAVQKIVNFVKDIINKVRFLKNELGQSEIFQKLIKRVEDIGNSIKNFFLPYINDAREALSKLSSDGNGLEGSFISKIISGFNTAAEYVRNFINTIREVKDELTKSEKFNRILSKIQEIRAVVSGVISDISNRISGKLSSIFDDSHSIDAAKIASIIDKVLGKLISLYNICKRFVTSALGYLAPFFQKSGSLAASAKGSFDGLNTAVDNVINSEKVEKTIVSLTNAVQKIVNFVKDIINKVRFLKNELGQSEIFQKLIKRVEDIGNSIKNFFLPYINDAREALSKLSSDGNGLEGSFISKIISGFNTAAEYVRNFINTIREVKDELTKSEKFNRILSKIQEIRAVVSGVISDISNRISGKLSSIFDDSHSIDAAKIASIIDKVLGKLISLYNICKRFVTSALGYLAPFFQKSGSLAASAKGSFDGLNTAIQGTASTLGNESEDVNGIFGAITRFHKKLSEWIKNPKLTKFLNDIGNTAKKVWNNISPLLDGIKSKFTNMNWSQIAIGSGIFMFLAFLLKMGDTFDKIGKSAESIAVTASSFKQIPVSISSFLKELSTTVKRIPIQKFADAILTVAASIAILAGSVYLLSIIPKEDMWRSILGIAALSGIIMAFGAGLAYLVSLSSKVGTVSKEVPLMILSLAAAVAVMAGALVIISREMNGDDGFSKMIDSIIAIAGIGLVLIGLMNVLARVAPVISKGAIQILFFSLSLFVIIKALEKLADITTNTDYKGIFEEPLAALLKIMLGLGALAFGASRLGFGGGVGVFAIVASLFLIIKVFEKLADPSIKETFKKVQENIEGMIETFGSIAAIALLAATLSNYTGKNILGLGVAVALMAGSLFIIVEALKRFAEIPTDRFRSSIGAVEQILIIFGVITLAMGVIGKDASQAGKSILLMSAAVYVLYTVIEKFTKMDPDALARGVLSVLSMLVAFSVAIALTSFGKNRTGPILAMAVSMIVIVESLTALTYYDLDRIFKAVLSMSLVLLALGTAMAIAGRTNISETSFMNFVGIAIIIATIAGSLFVLASKNWKDLIAPILGMATVLLAMGFAFSMIGFAYDTPKTALASLMNAVAMIGVLLTIVTALKTLSHENMYSLLASAVSIFIVVLAMAAGFSLMAKTLGSGKAAWSSMGATAVGMVVMLGAVWGVAVILKEYAGELGDVSNLIETAVSIAAIMLAMAAVMRIMSKVSFKGAVGGSLGFAAGFAIIIAAAAGIGALINVLDKEGVLDGAIMSGLDTFIAVCGKIGEAFGALTGGIASGIGAGIGNGIESIGESLGNFSTKVAPFLEQMKGVGTDVLTGIGNFGQGIADLAGANLKDNIIKLFGGTGLDKFGEQLSTFSEGLSGFMTTISKTSFDASKVESATKVVEAIAAMAKAIPETDGGLFGKIFGQTKLDDFGEQLKSFGTSLVEYAKSLSGTDEVAGLDDAAVTRVEKSVDIINRLATAVDSIPKLGGAVQAIVGESNVGTFGEGLKELGIGIHQMAVNLNFVDMDKLQSADEKIRFITSAMAAIGEGDGSEYNDTKIDNIVRFCSYFSQNSGEIVAYANALSEINPAVVSRGVDTIKTLGESAESLVTIAEQMSFEFGDIFSAQMSEKGTDAATALTTAFGAGIMTYVATATRKGVAIGQSAANGARQYSSFYWAGQNSASGYIEGLLSQTGRAAEAGEKLARRALERAKEVLEVNSPSKAFRRIGEFSGEGLALGFNDMTGEVENSVQGLASGVLDTAHLMLDRALSLLVSENDFNPTITPVLDLSQIQNGSRQLGSIIDFGRTIEITGALSRASKISGQFESNEQIPADNDSTNTTNGASFTFTQNNYSPKALSRADIYRQTKNQFSALKEAVTIRA